MTDGLLGKKIGMTQLFVENGNSVPVTVIEAGPCLVTDVKTREKDGYNALQLGFCDAGKQKLTRPQQKFFDKSNITPKVILREFRDGDTGTSKIGQTVDVGIFEAGDRLNITGTTKGRGFAGVIKRHGFHGAPASHGAHEIYRGGGSIGMCVHPGKVFKGKKMAGHYGNVKCTTLNVEVVRVEKKKNILLVKGAAPGPNGGLVLLRKSMRGKKK